MGVLARVGLDPYSRLIQQHRNLFDNFNPEPLERGYLPGMIRQKPHAPSLYIGKNLRSNSDLALSATFALGSSGQMPSTMESECGPITYTFHRESLRRP